MFHVLWKSPRLAPKNSEDKSTEIDDPELVAVGVDAPANPEVKIEKVLQPSTDGMSSPMD